MSSSSPIYNIVLLLCISSENIPLQSTKCNIDGWIYCLFVNHLLILVFPIFSEVLNEVSQTSETDSGLNSPKNEISRSSENLTGEDNLFESAHDRLSDTEVNDVNSRPLPKSDAEKSESFIRQEVDLLEPVETVESNEDITSLEDNEINLKGLTEVSSADFDPKPAAVDDTTQINDSLATQIIETNEASEPPVDPFKALEDLLAESSNERLQHKKKANQLSRNLWISCFVMLCLGIVVRISYSVGLSWIFNEVI